MRIAQLTRTLPRPDYAGGVSGQTDVLARALVARGHEVTVFAVNPPAEAADYEFRRVHIPSSVKRATPVLMALALAKLRFDDFDVIHSHGDEHLVRARPPIVRTFHGSSWSEARHATRFRHRLYHFAMGFPEALSEWRAAAVVVDAPSNQTYLKRPTAVISCAYDRKRYFPAEEKSERPSILFVGDLDTRKRGRMLLEAFSRQIRPAVPDAELWMVSADRPVGDGVIALGRVPPRDLADLYRRAWVFCLPSSYEGFGVPYVEAMASGTPVVATHNGGADDVLGAGQYGRVVADADLGSALVGLLQSAEERRRLACVGLERARAYESDQIAARYESVYRSCLETAARR
jgi:phosphatidylinositol alpha-mannosyltransferase